MNKVVRQKLSEFENYTYYDYYSFEDRIRIVYKVKGYVHTVVDMQQFDEHPFVLFEKPNMDMTASTEISYVIRRF
jgi:hypothetical protein